MSIACDICYEFYTDKSKSRLPRVLPRCGHEFCSSCVDGLCLSEVPICPKCRLPVFSRKTGRKKTSADCPVLRCLLEIEDRIDLRNGLSPKLIHKAIQKVPTQLLERELNVRKQFDLLKCMPATVLQQELECRLQDECDRRRRQLRDIYGMHAAPTTCENIIDAVPRGLTQNSCSPCDDMPSAPPQLLGSSELYGAQSLLRTDAAECSSTTANNARTTHVIDSNDVDRLLNSCPNRKSMDCYACGRTTEVSGVVEACAAGDDCRRGNPCFEFISFLFNCARRWLVACIVLKLLTAFRRHVTQRLKFLLQYWNEMYRYQRLQVLQILMVSQALPLLALAVYMNFASFFTWLYL